MTTLYGDAGIITRPVRRWSLTQGIHPGASIPYRPQTNGRAERAVGLIKEQSRRLLNTRVDPRYWHFAMCHASFLQRSPLGVVRNLPQFGDPVIAPCRSPVERKRWSRSIVGTYLGVGTDLEGKVHQVLVGDDVFSCEVVRRAGDSKYNAQEIELAQEAGFEVVSLNGRRRSRVVWLLRRSQLMRRSRTNRKSSTNRARKEAPNRKHPAPKLRRRPCGSVGTVEETTENLIHESRTSVA